MTAERPAPQDARGFEEWVRPYLARLANLIARLAPHADRDDVVQETLARAWAKRHLFDPQRGTAGAWLVAIAADQAAKAARSRQRRRAEPLLEEPTAKPDRDQRRVDLERALARLTDRQRLAVDCVYFVGLTVTETAAVMGCAEGTVKSTLADARARLRVLLEET